MKAADLKNSILQLAISGRLVPQDPADEPASVLYEQIQAEKNRLIKEGKIKASKKNDRINLPEPPFKIPDTWIWVKMEDVFQIIMGQSPDGEQVNISGNGVEFHQGKIYFSNRFLQQSKVTTVAPTKIAPVNSILLSVRAPVGKVNITRREICIGRGLCAIVAPQQILIDYAFICFEAMENEFIKSSTGTTFMAITGEVIKKQLIPLPPLAEQKRIVEKVEELEALINRYGNLAEELARLISAV